MKLSNLFLIVIIPIFMVPTILANCSDCCSSYNDRLECKKAYLDDNNKRVPGVCCGYAYDTRNREIPFCCPATTKCGVQNNKFLCVAQKITTGTSYPTTPTTTSSTKPTNTTHTSTTTKDTSTSSSSGSNSVMWAIIGSILGFIFLLVVCSTLCHVGVVLMKKCFSHLFGVVSSSLPSSGPMAQPPHTPRTDINNNNNNNNNDDDDDDNGGRGNERVALRMMPTTASPQPPHTTATTTTMTSDQQDQYYPVHLPPPQPIYPRSDVHTIDVPVVGDSTVKRSPSPYRPQSSLYPNLQQFNQQQQLQNQQQQQWVEARPDPPQDATTTHNNDTKTIFHHQNQPNNPHHDIHHENDTKYHTDNNSLDQSQPKCKPMGVLTPTAPLIDDVFYPNIGHHTEAKSDASNDNNDNKQ